MIDREHDLPITKQAKVLNISRGSVLNRPEMSYGRKLVTAGIGKAAYRGVA